MYVRMLMALAPRCGCERVVGFGWLKRTFCTIVTEGGFRDVNVRVRRYMCKDCRHTFLADAPFYDGCLYGKPVVDLCLYLAASNPFNRVESILTQYGIQVDRDTVKNYTILFRDRAVKIAGIAVMDDSKIGLNILKILFDVDSVEELREKHPNLIDELSGGFIRALTSNTIGGGNWRLKYELRADYVREESIEGRCLLSAIKDSTKTFKEGRPHRSFTNTNGTFNYQKMMGRRTIAGQPVETYIYH